MSELKTSTPDPDVSRAFARKVRLGTWALFFERVWPRLWVLIGVGALFAILSLMGVFLSLSAATHMAVLGLFAIAALAAIVYAARAPWPTREEAIRRIERRSGVAHRPATSYEDTLTAYTDSPETKALWQAHRDRLARAIQRLKVGTPSPRADRFDPFAVRALTMLLLVTAAGLATGSFYDRFTSAFKVGKNSGAGDTRVDVWVTPPAYTALPPIMLADGSKQTETAAGEAKLVEVPTKSVVTLRGTGFKGGPVVLEIMADGAKEPKTVAAEAPKDKIDIAETRFELTAPAIVRALTGGGEAGRWTFDVTPDNAPKIEIGKDFDRTPKGSLKLSYKAEDDYGIATAVAKVKQAKASAGDPKKAWARGEPLKGPRLPLERPPELPLKMPASGEKKFEASSLLDLGAHPWAGQKVELWLEATDVAGQTGKSEVVEMVLPARRFNKPLARAVIEQRRKLAEDSRNRPAVVRALDALTIEPEGFIQQSSVYLGLRSVFHRIERDNTRAAISQSIDHLWHLALKIEDGAMSDAEQEMKDAQDRLAKALENGASEEEIKALIQELKQAMNKYLEEMQKNAQKDGGGEEGDDGDKQISKEDLEEMMKDLEDSAENGAREEAEKLLSEMKELMEKLQSGQKSAEQKAQQERDKQFMKKLDQLSDLSGKQSKLMDDTFADQQQRPGQKKGQKGQGNNKQQGQMQGGDAQQGDQMGQQQGGGQGKEGQGQGREPKSGQEMSGTNNPDGTGGLKDRQSQLRKNLEQLRKDLEEMGASDSEKLGNAESSMKKAEESLDQNDSAAAAEHQGQALDQMRQQAQDMAKEMQQNAQNRAGKNQDKNRDPLDRPQRSEGPDLGNSVKVPNAIDAQRAREILEELRKRSGEALRPPIELDYIDRLLKRF